MRPEDIPKIVRAHSEVDRQSEHRESSHGNEEQMYDTDLGGKGERLPKLILFRSVREGMPAFLLSQVAEQSRCLSQFFELIELPPVGDYDEICDRHEPDLVLFESGVDSGKRQIWNTSAQSHIPKLGFLHADAVDMARGTFISDMAEWGVETFFTHSVAMGEYTPEIADRLYVWPVFIDPDLFHDYGLQKVVPILFTGAQIGFYPWRNAVSRVLSMHRPTMTCPHVGWHEHAGARRMLFGEKYARLLNASTFVPACGSVTRELVRKHLEIPAAGACLVTERTAALESIGFRDMENCVFATPEDVVEKLDMLFDDQELLSRIIRAGHDLVHSRHTMVHRNQIRQWFDLRCRLSAGETIIQDGPAGRLRIVPAVANQANIHVVSGGLDRRLLRRGWDLIGAGLHDPAETLFLRCLNHALVPEALVGLAYCQLLKGDSEAAKNSIERWLDITFLHHKCKDPDPVAWATRIRVALCCGKLDEACAKALQFPDLRHQELDRIRKLLRADAGETGDSKPCRASIAPTPHLSEEDWKLQLNLMLRACDQDAIESAIAAGHLPVPAVAIDSGGKSRPAEKGPAVRGSARTLVGRAKARLRGLKKTLTENDWTFQIERAISCEPALRAVILEPSPFNLGQRAVRRSLKNNPWLPKIIGIGSAELIDSSSQPVFRPGDLVYVTAKTAERFDLTSLVDSAGVVLVEGANRKGGQRLTELLLDSEDFSLIMHDATDKVGYAIFRRLTLQFAWLEGVLGERSSVSTVSASQAQTAA